LYSDRSLEHVYFTSGEYENRLDSFFLSLQRSAGWAILSIYTCALTLCLMGSFLSEIFSP